MVTTPILFTTTLGYDAVSYYATPLAADYGWEFGNVEAVTQCDVTTVTATALTDGIISFVCAQQTYTMTIDKTTQKPSKFGDFIVSGDGSFLGGADTVNGFFGKWRKTKNIASPSITLPARPMGTPPKRRSLFQAQDDQESNTMVEPRVLVDFPPTTLNDCAVTAAVAAYKPSTKSSTNYFNSYTDFSYGTSYAYKAGAQTFVSTTSASKTFSTNKCTVGGVVYDVIGFQGTNLGSTNALKATDIGADLKGLSDNFLKAYNDMVTGHPTLDLHVDIAS